MKAKEYNYYIKRCNMEHWEILEWELKLADAHGKLITIKELQEEVDDMDTVCQNIEQHNEYAYYLKDRDPIPMGRAIDIIYNEEFDQLDEVYSYPNAYEAYSYPNTSP